MRQQFDTRAVRAGETFAYWREAVCDAYVQLGCETDQPRGFWGEIRLERLPKLSVSFVTSAAQDVHRRRSDIAKAKESYFLISLQMHSSSSVTQRNREALIAPGDFALYSSTDPYRLHMPEDFRQLVLQIPRAELLRRLPNADLLTGRPVSAQSEVGALVSRSILQFSNAVSGPAETVRHFMQDSIIDMVATGLASLEDSRLELSLPEQQTAMRAKAFIQSHLDNPALDRSRVADAVGLSLRRLSEIFAAEGLSLAAYIREARLQRIADALVDQRYQRLSISDIAMRWGVTNLQHFSRIFRDRYGVSPRAYRHRARPGGLN